MSGQHNVWLSNRSMMPSSRRPSPLMLSRKALFYGTRETSRSRKCSIRRKAASKSCHNDIEKQQRAGPLCESLSRMEEVHGKSR